MHGMGAVRAVGAINVQSCDSLRAGMQKVIPFYLSLWCFFLSSPTNIVTATLIQAGAKTKTPNVVTKC